MGDNDKLMQEIRDLLIPISALARSQLAQEGPERLRTAVGSGQRLSAAKLMDGTRNRAEIQRATGISAPNLSTLLKDLRERGLVTERDGKPQLVIGPGGIWKNSKSKEDE